MATNYRQLFAKQKKYETMLKKVNPNLNNDSGIYVFTRVDENGFKYAYPGQSLHVLDRLISHMCGYEQWIDLSLKKHGLYSESNPYGWKVSFKNYPANQLDDMEKAYIKWYAENGYQLRNVSVGGQGENRSGGQINERKPSKGYRDGIEQGRKNLARELSDIIDKHLTVTIKPEKANNKVSQKQFEKFKELLGGDNDG